MNKRLLSNKPFKVTQNGYKNSTKIALSIQSNVKVGQEFYEFKKKNGIIELVPVELINIEDYI